MNELHFNQRYHIAHLLGTEFDKRMYNVYQGMNTNTRPPFLEHIFNESTQAQALIFLEEAKQSGNPEIHFPNFDSVYEAVWQDDCFAKAEVLMQTSSCSYEDVFNDIFTYLEHNRMSVLMGDGNYHKEQARLINSPVIQIW
jgi:hypothetical protein